jgi:hypothetical protein
MSIVCRAQELRSKERITIPFFFKFKYEIHHNIVTYIISGKNFKYNKTTYSEKLKNKKKV